MDLITDMRAQTTPHSQTPVERAVGRTLLTLWDMRSVALLVAAAVAGDAAAGLAGAAAATLAVYAGAVADYWRKPRDAAFLRQFRWTLPGAGVVLAVFVLGTAAGWSDPVDVLSDRGPFVAGVLAVAVAAGGLSRALVDLVDARRAFHVRVPFRRVRPEPRLQGGRYRRPERPQPETVTVTVDPRDSWPEYARVLGLDPGESLEVFESVYRTKAKRAHPDNGGTDAEMARLAAAMEDVRRMKRPKTA